MTWRDTSHGTITNGLCLLLLYHADVYDGLEAVRQLPINNICFMKSARLEGGLTCGHLQ